MVGCTSNPKVAMRTSLHDLYSYHKLCFQQRNICINIYLFSCRIGLYEEIIRAFFGNNNNKSKQGINSPYLAHSMQALIPFMSK